MAFLWVWVVERELVVAAGMMTPWSSMKRPIRASACAWGGRAKASR